MEIASREAVQPGPELREPGLAICLSGGGYRAMLFHLGALRRLNDFGLMSAADRFSSVSGGAIAAAVLASRWGSLEFDDAGRAVNFDVIEDVIRAIASRTLDWPSAVVGVLPGTTGAGRLAQALTTYFGETTMAELTARSPRFTFNTTNMQTGNLFRWSREYGADYTLGRIDAPAISVAAIVAASAAFPPWLSPLRVPVPGVLVDHERGEPVKSAPGSLWLTDGGVYDNLGVETAKSFHTVLISDGGAPFDAGRRLRSNVLSQSLRTAFILNDHVGRQRRRQFVADLRSGRRRGALWPIGTPLSAYPASDCLVCAPAAVRDLAATPTRLKRMPLHYQYRLANWGYASADAALRSYLEPDLSAPTGFPYPGGV
jgi:NTE family protein